MCSPVLVVLCTGGMLSKVQIHTEACTVTGELHVDDGNVKVSSASHHSSPRFALGTCNHNLSEHSVQSE
jgi:hypothetical protein